MSCRTARPIALGAQRASDVRLGGQELASAPREGRHFASPASSRTGRRSCASRPRQDRGPTVTRRRRGAVLVCPPAVARHPAGRYSPYFSSHTSRDWSTSGTAQILSANNNCVTKQSTPSSPGEDETLQKRRQINQAHHEGKQPAVVARIRPSNRSGEQVQTNLRRCPRSTLGTVRHRSRPRR